MQHLNNQSGFVGTIDLRAPEVHDFSGMPAIRPNRVLAVALVVIAVLTMGHLASQIRGTATDARAAAETAESRG